MKRVSQNPKKIMMISRDLSCPDFYSEMDKILNFAVTEKTDILLFALFSLDLDHMLNESFRTKLKEYTRKYKKFIVLEFTDLEDFQGNTVLCFNSGEMKVFYQWYGRSNDDDFWKEALLGELPNRIFNGDTLLLICGELSLGLKVNKKTKLVEDPYNFMGWLKNNNIKYILNPFHDTAVRYEVNYKKRELSCNGRKLVSVWNRNPKKHHNSVKPFQFFCDGYDKTNSIRWFESFETRPDIKIAIAIA